MNALPCSVLVAALLAGPAVPAVVASPVAPEPTPVARTASVPTTPTVDTGTQVVVDEHDVAVAGTAGVTATERAGAGESADGDGGAADGTEPELTASTATSSVIETRTFQTVALTWSAADGGAQHVSARTRVDGEWTGWSELGDEEVSPDPGTADEAGEVRGGTPSLWVGEADAVQFAFPEGEAALPADLRAVTIGEEPADATSGTSGATATEDARISDAVYRTATQPATAPALSTAVPGLLRTATAAPRVVSREAWGARAPICAPDVAGRLVGAVVHHTAGADYATPEAAMAQIRNDQRYHIESRGWCDLGYNFVVDKWGNIYEGRDNSLEQAVIGVHAGGFNTGTVGISMLGTYTSTAPSAAAVDAVAHIAGWRLAAYGANPSGSIAYTTLGGENSRFPAGTTVNLPTIFAHRDVAFTSCPGDLGYAALGRMRQAASGYASQYDLTGLGYNLVRTADSPDVYLVTDRDKHRLTGPAILDALAVLGPVGVVTPAQLASRATGAELGRFLRDRSGNIFLFDQGRLYSVRSCDQLAAWGASCDTYRSMGVLDSQIARFARGNTLSTAFSTPQGAQWLVQAGQRREIADAASLAQSGLGADGPVIALSAALAAELPYGAPVVRTGIAVRDRGTGRVVLLDRADGVALSAAAADVTAVARGIGVRPLDSGSVARMPAPRAELTGVIRAADGRRIALTMGGAVVLSAGQLADDPGLPVGDAIVTALKPQAAPTVLFARSVASGSLYLLDGGTRRPVVSMAAVYALTQQQTPVVAVVGQAPLDAVPAGGAVLQPATLVKVQGQPDVFVVDGARSLVHVPSFDVVRATGLSTAYTEVAPGVLSAYSRSSGSLGTLWSCGGQTLVALDGRMSPVTAQLAATGAPATAVDASTCAAAPRGGSLGGSPVFVRAGGSSAIWLLDAGTRRPVRSMDTVYALAAGARVVVAEVTPVALAALPEAGAVLTPGRLVKSAAGPEIYLVDGADGLVHVPAFGVVAAVGLSTAYTQVPAADLAAYDRAASSLSTLWSCGGLPYLGVDGRLAPVPTHVLTAAGAPASVMSPATCAAAPRSPMVVAPVFVHATGDSTIYLLESGTKRPVGSMDTVYRLAASTRLLLAEVPAAGLAATPTGARV